MLRRVPTILLGLAVIVVAGCKTGSGPLNPARDLVGTWKTTFPVTVYFDDEWCTSSLSRVASQVWDVTWVVTRRSTNADSLDVKMTFGTSNFQNLGGCPDTGVVPEVSPMFLTGYVNGDRLTLMSGQTPAGSFSFTTDNIQGDFDYTWCAGDCQREYSADRTFILNKQ